MNNHNRGTPGGEGRGHVPAAHSSAVIMLLDVRVKGLPRWLVSAGHSPVVSPRRTCPERTQSEEQWVEKFADKKRKPSGCKCKLLSFYPNVEASKKECSCL